MCELFGLSAAEPFAANESLKEFFSHSNRHPHGWGLACVSKNDALVEKESVKALDSHYLRERLSQPVKSRIMLAHIRFATIGNVEYKNCHPFSGCDNSGRRWTLIHNGTIFDYPPLAPYVKRQSGDTDSERIFLYLLDRLSEEQKRVGGRLRFAQRFALLSDIITEMAAGNKLNLLFTDGKYLYAHCNCRGTLHFLTEKNRTLLSTQPLGSGSWQEVPFCRLLAFHRGRTVQTGQFHGNEYIEDKQAVELLYRIFSNL